MSFWIIIWTHSNRIFSFRLYSGHTIWFLRWHMIIMHMDNCKFHKWFHFPLPNNPESLDFGIRWFCCLFIHLLERGIIKIKIVIYFKFLQISAYNFRNPTWLNCHWGEDDALIFIQVKKREESRCLIWLTEILEINYESTIHWKQQADTRFCSHPGVLILLK